MATKVKRPTTSAADRTRAPRRRKQAPGSGQVPAPPTGADREAIGLPPKHPAGPSGQAGPAPGLDDARHAAAQRSAHAADVLRQAYLPACLATALGMARFDAGSCQVYLDRFLQDAGSPRDPVERLLLEQLGFAHLRLADLHARAAGAQSVEATKVLTGAAARLMGEVRRTALAVREYQERLPQQRKLRLAQVG